VLAGMTSVFAMKSGRVSGVVSKSGVPEIQGCPCLERDGSGLPRTLNVRRVRSDRLKASADGSKRSSAVRFQVDPLGT